MTTTTMSGADALLEQILANGTDTIFGLPGGQLDHFFDSMYRQNDRLRFFGSRHEQGAAYMAFGYSRSTGKPGVYCVVPGPGVLNTTAALCSAYATNSPVLCLTGQIPSRGIGQGVGYLHELPDQLATLRSLTKWGERINSATEAPSVVNEAYRQMRSGRSQPVALEMPMDIMGQQAPVDLLAAATAAGEPELNSDEIDKAAKLIGAASKPMIIVGGGGNHAAAQINALAERLQAPVVAFRNGRGIVSDKSHLSQVLPAGYELWAESDLVIGIGSRMEQQLMHWGRNPAAKLIRIDIDERELDRYQPVDARLHADTKTACQALFDAIDKNASKVASREEELLGLKSRVRAEIESVQPQLSYLDAIRTALPEEGYFVDEITQVGYASWYGFPVYEPRHLITCGYQGTLGYGYATALGVKAAHPDKPVVNIAGDGGFMFTANEMATAAQYNLGLVTVVFNNNKFQNVQRQQKDWFGGRLIGSDLKNPDFLKFAESFGIRACRVQKPADLQSEVAAALTRDEPALIEVNSGDMATPWPYIIRDRLFD
ncbi:MAG: thiamine pyrophosphate-dependent enzyme [Pseudomonadota bacterium]